MPRRAAFALAAILLAQIVFGLGCGSSGGGSSSGGSSGGGSTGGGPPGGTLAGQLTVDRQSLSFGVVPVGESSPQTVTVTANSASVTLSAATTTGAGFSVTGPIPIALAAGESTSYTVNFMPSAPGDIAGTLSFSSTAGNSLPPISLSGTGAGSQGPPSSHSVTLNWVPSPSGDVVGYYVYRGTQSGGPYSKLTAAVVANTGYTDASVDAGATYYYVVTALDGNDMESSYSNEASATVASP